jgi:hypothetical protein
MTRRSFTAANPGRKAFARRLRRLTQMKNFYFPFVRQSASLDKPIEGGLQRRYDAIDSTLAEGVSK